MLWCVVCACCGGRAAHGNHGAGVSFWVCRTLLGPRLHVCFVRSCAVLVVATALLLWSLVV